MSFPSVLAADDLLVDVNALIDIWDEAENKLKLIARDPEFLMSRNVAASFARTQDLIREARAELEAMRERTLLWIQQTVGPHVARGAADAVASLAAQGATIPGTVGLANTASIRILSEEILADTEFAISSAQRTLRRSFRATQQQLVTEAALSESLLISEVRLENADQRTKRLVSLFERNSLDGKFVNVNGRFYRLSTYADIIGRTRLAEASIEGSIQATLAMGIDTVRVSDHGPTDQFCDPFAGKVFSISGRDSRFPRLRRRPPFHPNCRHTLLPFTPELEDPDELTRTIAKSNVAIPGNIEDFDRASA